MVANNSSVVLIENDLETREFLSENLKADNYDVTVGQTVQDGLRLIKYVNPAVAVVNPGLPDESGLKIIREVRASNSQARIDHQLPIAVLSDKISEIDRLRAFECGADDFIAKPFSYAELKLRLQALIRRRAYQANPSTLRTADVSIDPNAYTASTNGQQLKLSHKEFMLLKKLASNPNRVFTKEELLRDIWGYGSVGATRTLDAHACRLRKKLRSGGAQLVWNVWGVGYRLAVGENQAV